MIYDIRGGLGTQMLSMFAVYADALSKGYEVNRICLNTGGYPDGVRDVGVNFMPQLFDFKDPDFFTEDKLGTRKFNPFEPEHLTLMLDYWPEIRERFVVNVDSAPTNHMKYFHMRGLDRKYITIEKMWRIYNHLYRDFYIMSDDLEIYKSGHEKIISGCGQNALEDWNTMALNAHMIVGPYSTFTLSMAMLNEKINLYIMHPAMYDGVQMIDKDYKAIDRICKEFTNINWLDIRV